MLETVLGNVRYLMVTKPVRDLSNQPFTNKYYEHFDLARVTSSESIVRARRLWISKAKDAFNNGCRDSWVLLMIPSQDRMVQCAVMQENYREAFRQ